MNYLGHAFVSVALDHSAERLTGNVLGDAIGKSDKGSLSEELKAGLVVHRLLDSYTDRHPSVRECRAILRPVTGRCSSIVLDVALDYFLSNTITEYGDFTLRGVADVSYRAMAQSRSALPLNVRHLASALIADDRFVTYQTSHGLEMALTRIAEWRPRIGLDPVTATKAVMANKVELELRARQFFPELLKAELGDPLPQ